MPQADTTGWTGVGTFTFQDGKAVYRHQGEIDYECEATYEVVEDFMRITYPIDQGVCSGASMMTDSISNCSLPRILHFERIKQPVRQSPGRRLRINNLLYGKR